MSPKPPVTTTPDALMSLWREVVVAVLRRGENVYAAINMADQVVQEHSTRLAKLQAGGS